MKDQEPDETFVRITNIMIYNELHAFKKEVEKRLNRLEVMVGAGILGIAGSVVKAVWFSG